MFSIKELPTKKPLKSKLKGFKHLINYFLVFVSLLEFSIFSKILSVIR
jgi:hypothetical protein